MSNGNLVMPVIASDGIHDTVVTVDSMRTSRPFLRPSPTVPHSSVDGEPTSRPAVPSSSCPRNRRTYPTPRCHHSRLPLGPTQSSESWVVPPFPSPSQVGGYSQPVTTRPG